MDELNNQDPVDEIVEEEELGLTDKIVGVLSEPSRLFSGLSKLPVNTSDWILPLLFVIVVAIVSSFAMMNNPEIKADMTEKQIALLEKQMQEAVDKGRMTQEQADDIIENAIERMEEAGTGQILMSSVFIIIFTFITFFITSGVFYMLSKFMLDGDGDYKTSMLAYGLPHYIIAIQIIVMIILALTMNRLFIDTSVGSFMDIPKDTFSGMLLHKLDIFSIWFYAVVSIGFAKMFKSDNVGKYFIMVFGVWIGFSILMYFVTQALPFLKWFGM